MIVDVHAHWYSEEVIRAVVQYSPDVELERLSDGTLFVRWRGSVASIISPVAGDLDDRITLMDELGIQTQLLTFGAIDIGWAGDHAGDVARKVNDLLADVCRSRPDRFRFLAVVALGEPASMIDELERALSLGAVGMATTTTFGGRHLDAPEYREFWRQANDRRLPVSVHPCFPVNGPTGDPGGFLVCGFPGETTLAASRLVLSGTMGGLPNLRVVWAHVGGGLPMLVRRIDAGTRKTWRGTEPPSSFFRRCYYDTVCAHGPALDCARETFGVSQLLFGTDEPHRLDLPIEILATLENRPWPEEEKRAVLGDSARRLFGIG